MSIEKIFNKYGCDKAKKHSYHLLYDKVLSEYDSPKILEIGVFKGDSTLAFLEYKPTCQIVGIDLFERVTKEDVESRFSNKNAKFYRCDSLNRLSVDKIMRVVDKKFDIIIDDGAHWPKANQTTLINFMPYLANNGTYIIEDVWPLDKMTTEQLKHKWLIERPQLYSMIDHYSFLDEVNKYETVQHHDYRKITNQPDSYIISIKK